MKHMFKILLLPLLLLASQANAAWYLQQGADGGTYWVDTKDSEANHVSEGRISLFMPDISVASTGYIAVPVKGDIERVYSVLYGSISSASAETLRLFIGTGASSATGPTSWIEVSNAVTGPTIAASSVTGASDTNATLYSISNTVTEGGVIAVFSPGSSVSASSATVPAMITIIINPK